MHSPATAPLGDRTSLHSISKSSNLFSGIDWATYQDVRPPYPPSTLNLLLAHHRRHSGRYQLAHDVGAGDAVFTPQLMPSFDHVHVSDPSAANMEKAKAKLEPMVKSSNSTTTVSYSVAGAEEMDLAGPRNGVDFVSVMEALHWADGARAIAAAARSLRSGGTLALVLYNIGVTVPLNARVDGAFQAMMPELWRTAFRSAPVSIQTKLLEVAAQQHVAYSCVELAESEWRLEHCQRIWINSHGGGEACFQKPSSGIVMAHDAGRAYCTSRVHPDEQVVYYDDDDVEARDWRLLVGKHWFKAYLCSLMDTGGFMESAAWAAFERVLEEEVGAGTVVVEWPVNIVLATRR